PPPRLPGARAARRNFAALHPGLLSHRNRPGRVAPHPQFARSLASARLLLDRARGGTHMIQKVSHMVVYVLDQQRAYDFYVNKLGFDVRTDAKMGDFRWLTVGPKGQPDLEITLMEP